MSRERIQTLLIVAALAGAAAISWGLQLREPLEVDARRLVDVPLEFPQWTGVEIPMQGDVEKMLDADFNVQRRYFDPIGGLVWFYVGYYGTERGGRPEHTPWACYPSNGWEILRHEVVSVSGDSDRRANELVVQKGEDRRLVHFWYQSHRRTGMLGGFDQALERLIGTILEGRSDGSLIRLSTPLRSGENEVTARSRLVSFGRAIVPELERNWPQETAASGS